jgi:hypothetical protein
MAMAECLGETFCSLEVVQVVKPIRKLANSVFKPRAPFGIAAFGLPLENAIRTAVFELNDTEPFLFFISKHQIGSKISEEGILKR